MVTADTVPGGGQEGGHVTEYTAQAGYAQLGGPRLHAEPRGTDTGHDVKGGVHWQPGLWQTPGEACWRGEGWYRSYRPQCRIPKKITVELMEINISFEESGRTSLSSKYQINDTFPYRLTAPWGDGTFS